MSTSGLATLVGVYFSQLQQLASDADRRNFFSEQPALLSRSTVEELTARATSHLRIDPREAESLVTTALWLAEELGDDFSRGRANRAYANLAHVRGDASLAIAHYKLAKRLFEHTGADLEAAITASSSLQALVFQGKHDEALEESKFARAVFERLGDRLRLARLNANYANLLHHRDRWADAARHYEAAYHDFLEIGEKQDVAVCLTNMAVCHQKRNDFSQALAFYQKTRGYCEENGLAALIADLDYNIAYLHYLRGQYTTALELYRETRARNAELGHKHHVDLCALDEAEIYLELNLLGECVDLAKAAYSGFRDRGLTLESARALTILAIAENRQGKTFLALELLAQAQDLFRQEGNDLWVGVVALYRATVYSRVGRSFEGRQLAQVADGIFQRFALTTKAAASKILLGRLAMGQGSLQEARTSCSAALALLRDDDAPALKYQAHYLLGEIEKAAGANRRALDSYLLAHEYLERTTGSIQTDEQKIPAIDDKSAIYESLVDLLVHSQPNMAAREQAFLFVEKSKSRSLTDLLAFRAHALPTTHPGRSKLADQVRKLREELNWYYRQIDLQEMRTEERSLTDVDALRRYSRQQENRLIRTLGKLQETDKEFISVQEAFSVDIDLLRSALPRGTTLLEYFIAKGTVYALVVDEQRLDVVPVTLISTVDGLRRSLAASFSRSGFTRAQRNRDDNALPLSYLEALNAELIEPIDPLIRNERLVIVPHASLFYLPFHAFRARGAYLGDRCTVSYAPSATAYYLATQKAKSPTATGSAILCPGDGREHPDLVRRIAQFLPSPDLLDAHASVDEILSRGSGRTRIVHLFTSGEVRDDNPMFSTVLVGRGPIHLFDLFQLRVDADLVTVSGWSPGHRADAKGNEMVGLVRGLLYAGARAVLTTFWPVDDPVWVGLADEFYRGVREGRSFEVSLREAIAAVRLSHSNPRDWAPFVLFGDAR